MALRPIKDYLSPDVRKKIADVIEVNGGNEVFFQGNISDGTDVLDTVEALAWGNDTSVPAILRSLAPGDVVIHNHALGIMGDPEAINESCVDDLHQRQVEKIVLKVIVWLG